MSRSGAKNAAVEHALRIERIANAGLKRTCVARERWSAPQLLRRSLGDDPRTDPTQNRRQLPHRHAGGRDDRPVAARRPPVEFTATLDLEPPVDRVDTVAFSARNLAERFIGDLAGHGLA